MPNTREIRALFSKNLQQLVEEKGMQVSHLCRQIGVNRTQFNRYLSGEASPRPDVLYRVCVYFGVDGRIVLEPLDSIRRNDMSLDMDQATTVDGFLFGDDKPRSRRNPPPSGLHRYWQTSSVRPGWANSYTIRIFNLSDTTVFRAIIDPRHDGVANLSIGDRHGSEVRGVLMEIIDGLVVHAFQVNGNRVSFTFLNHPMLSDRAVYPGLVMVGRPASDLVSRIQRCALEILPQDGRLLSRLRRRGGRPTGDLPPYLHDILTQDVR